MNFVEGIIPGASRGLPSSLMLQNLELKRLGGKACMKNVSDRKDFYHQMKVSPERAASNALWPPIFLMIWKAQELLLLGVKGTSKRPSVTV